MLNGIMNDTSDRASPFSGARNGGLVGCCMVGKEGGGGQQTIDMVGNPQTRPSELVGW